MVGQPGISIFIPNYKSGAYAGQCIKSARKQTFSEWRVVICDIGFTDVSMEKLWEFSESDGRVQFY